MSAINNYKQPGINKRILRLRFFPYNARMLLVVPFFAVTILYRAFAIGFLICMAGIKLSALPILALALAQVISFRNLGLDLPRCLVYGGLCSFLSPSGYSRGRDPLDQPLGMALVKQRRRRCQTTSRADLDEDEKSSSCGCCCGDSQEEEHYWVGDRTPEQVLIIAFLSRPTIGRVAQKSDNSR